MKFKSLLSIGLICLPFLSCGQDTIAELRQKAEQGEAKAQTSLGYAYYSGEDVPQNYTEAVKWYRLAADQGYAKAQDLLGSAYWFGKGVSTNDYTEAVKWYRLAADQGYAKAQYNLGLSYVVGEGVSDDYTEAVKWYRLAADQGYAKAQVGLGGAYFNGAGVPQDYTEAVKWYRLAADQGDQQAQVGLGGTYFNGAGVPQDYTEAVKWYRLAEKQGDAVAKSIVASKLEKLPPPTDMEFSAKEVLDKKVELAGKIIKVKFNRTYDVQKNGDVLFTGQLCSRVKPINSTYTDIGGVMVDFPQEGLGFFLQSLSPLGVETEKWIEAMAEEDRWGVYVLVGSGNYRSVAIGDDYTKDGDEGKYRWSVKTEIPDFSTKHTVSVSDVFLSPNQLNGKIVGLIFYDTWGIRQKSAEEYIASISCGRGHKSAKIKIPVAGYRFFKKLEHVPARSSKDYIIYALIKVSPAGSFLMEAKGARISGEEDHAEYRW